MIVVDSIGYWDTTAGTASFHVIGASQGYPMPPGVSAWAAAVQSYVGYPLLELNAIRLHQYEPEGMALPAGGCTLPESTLPSAP